MGEILSHFFCSLQILGVFRCVSVENERLVGRIRELVAPWCASRHVELVELEYHPSRSHSTLKFLLDTPAGITVEELKGASQAFGALLDEQDVIPGRFLLEVSSPGLDRRLKTMEDFERVVGRRVWIQMKESLEGAWEFRGEVVSVGDRLVTIKLDDGNKVRVPLESMGTARQEVVI